MKVSGSGHFLITARQWEAHQERALALQDGPLGGKVSELSLWTCMELFAGRGPMGVAPHHLLAQLLLPARAARGRVNSCLCPGPEQLMGRGWGDES